MQWKLEKQTYNRVNVIPSEDKWVPLPQWRASKVINLLLVTTENEALLAA